MNHRNSKFFSHYHTTKLNDNNWTCSVCNTTIFGNKTKCVVCKADKVVDTTIKSTEDWLCKNCNFKIYHLHTTCRKCGLSKDFQQS